MGNKITKIHFDNKVFLTLLSFFLLGTILLTFNILKKTDCNIVDFEIIADSKTTLDLIEFKSIGDKQYEWEWDFGDNSDKKYVSNTIHQYKKDSTYIVTLKVNGNCILTKEVVIKKKNLVNPVIKKMIPEVNFPRTIRQGDEVVFACTSDFATKWEWRFGESQRVDATTAKVKYKFKRAGSHRISLITNGDDESIYMQRINVLPKVTPRVVTRTSPRVDRTDETLNQIPDAPPEIEEPKVPISELPPTVPVINFTKDNVITMLNDYADEKINYLSVSHNFCSENTKVIGKKNKNTTLKHLLESIRGHKVRITSLTVLKGSNGCIKLISIDSQIKTGMFWKTF